MRWLRLNDAPSIWPASCLRRTNYGVYASINPEENFYQIRKALLLERLDRLSERACLPLALLLRTARPLLSLATGCWMRLTPIPSIYRTPLLNTLLELLFALLQAPGEHGRLDAASLQPLLEQSRCAQVLANARLLVADFCIRAMQALTGTLFHFWISRVRPQGIRPMLKR